MLPHQGWTCAQKPACASDDLPKSPAGRALLPPPRRSIQPQSLQQRRAQIGVRAVEQPIQPAGVLGVIHDGFLADHFLGDVAGAAHMVAGDDNDAFTSPSPTLCSPVHIRPLNTSGLSFSRSPRPCLTAAMNCW